MPLFFDKTSGRYIHLGIGNGFHKVDDITKYNKKTNGKLFVKKKDGSVITITDFVARVDIENSLKKEGKQEEQ